MGVAHRPETIFSTLKGGLYYVDSRSCFLAVPGRGIGMAVFVTVYPIVYCTSVLSRFR